MNYEQYRDLFEINSGSSWKYKDNSCVLIVLDENDENNQEQKLWCRVIKIWLTKEKIEHCTMLWSFIIGLIKSGLIMQIK